VKSAGDFGKLSQRGLEVFDLGSARASRVGNRALAVANFPFSFQRSDRLV